MASTDYDVVIGGTKAKVLRAEDGGYRKRTLRREVEQQLLSQSENPSLVSRADQRQLFQTSWAGGSRWWKPLITPSDLESYFQANHMDVWSEPGKVVPGNQVVDAANTSIHDNCVIGTDGSGDVYAIGATNNVNASFLDVYKWTPASDAFVQETGYHSGIAAGESPTSMVYDNTDGYFYVYSADGDEIVRFNPATSAEDAAWLSAGSTTSTNLVIHREGILQMSETISVIDKSGPSLTSSFTNGLGPDLMGDVSVSGTNPLVRRVSNAVSTPEGIYYFINSVGRSQPSCWIFRLDKDQTGNWISNPIATLPAGNVATSIGYHLGSVMVAASPDWRTLLNNDTKEAEMVLYAISGQSGISVLGSFLGGRDELDETPYAILESTGSILYIGGHKRLWVYDAARGGLHPAFEWPTELSNGAYVSMAFVEDSDGDSAMIFLGRNRIARIKVGRADDPDTVTDFGDDETHYQLTSNYFDGGLPFESKELTRVEIMHEELDTGDETDANQEWTVQISADDGAFSDALVNSSSDSTYASADVTGTSGRRFQYRLIYQTKNTLRKGLRGLKVALTTGEMITEWDLTLDGAELLNIDNEVQDEEAFYDALVTLANTATITTLVDNMQEQGQETDTGTTTNVKVQAVEILKEKPGESRIRVVLREA